MDQDQPLQQRQKRSKDSSHIKRTRNVVLQQASESLLVLLHAIARIPECIDTSLDEGTLHLSSAINFVGQYLADLIRQILGGEHVILFALAPSTGRLRYVAISGLSPEQEQRCRESNEHFTLTDLFDKASIARLSANKEVIIASERIRFPVVERRDEISQNCLWIPISLSGQLTGSLVTSKIGRDSGYTPEEIKLVKAITGLTALVLESYFMLNRLEEMQDRERILQETEHLISDFLSLVGHELRTPLTVVMGNIQLAQRRLQTLQQQVAEQPKTLSKQAETLGEQAETLSKQAETLSKQAETLGEQVEQVQHPLESAELGARVQNRMIDDMIDDAHIQTNTFTLHMKPCDLVELVREAVGEQQQQAPERTILLNIMPTVKSVPIIADADRIRKVVTTYLVNALTYSPADQSVTVRVAIEDTVARVSVHNEGPGIPPKEQKKIWERFYRVKGLAVQHELDLSVGLGLYLCRQFITRHQGEVGVESTHGKGSTFWFTLPIARP